MKRFRIQHKTTYDFPSPVQLLPHTLRLRPREGHELRIENSKLDIFPEAKLRWHRDAEGNCVATATFDARSHSLTIKSEVIIQQFDLAPHDFLVADYAVDYPFKYLDGDMILLSPYMRDPQSAGDTALTDWLHGLTAYGENIQTYALLKRLNERIYSAITYVRREEEGVQSPQETLSTGAGSCRDTAKLFMEAARKLGFAARFVSGYIYSESATPLFGSTHAWAEVFIPGAGWKGFDPTTGNIVGADHIAIAVARLAESVPPVSGTYYGVLGATMGVNVWVTEVS